MKFYSNKYKYSKMQFTALCSKSLFSCFSICKSKNQKTTQKTLCCFSKSNMKFEK